MDRTLLTLTPANVFSIALCGLLGYWLLVGAGKANQAVTGNVIGGGS